MYCFMMKVYSAHNAALPQPAIIRYPIIIIFLPLIMGTSSHALTAGKSRGSLAWSERMVRVDPAGARVLLDKWRWFPQGCVNIHWML